MKKTFLYFCLLFIVQTAFAADSLYVREQQIPILIDRIDNVLYEMRIPAQKGDVLNEITIQIGDNVDLSDIQAIRLFYSGVEAPSAKGNISVPLRTYPAIYREIPVRLLNLIPYGKMRLPPPCRAR